MARFVAGGILVLLVLGVSLGCSKQADLAFLSWTAVAQCPEGMDDFAHRRSVARNGMNEIAKQCTPDVLGVRDRAGLEAEYLDHERLKQRGGPIVIQFGLTDRPHIGGETSALLRHRDVIEQIQTCIRTVLAAVERSTGCCLLFYEREEYVARYEIE